MKYRTDFVTNSSSSSFLISKRYLSEDQIEKIYNHSTLGEELGISNSDWPWDIDENEKFIFGYTTIDNFSISDFFEQIGVNDSFVEWGESLSDFDELDEYEEY